MTTLNQAPIDDFLATLAQFYADFGRHDMLWRQPSDSSLGAAQAGGFEPYKILVSELMLQQTQVARVTPKYAAFLVTFPSVQALAAAPLGEVLKLWNGLGYNRRAKFLWQAAQLVVHEYGGVFPHTLQELQKLPGVGPNTAGAIMAYAYNQPVVYLETNIRTVIIHHFFRDKTGIADKDIRQVLEQIAARLGEPGAEPLLTPRQFYWAMMDYGAFLKQSVGNLNRDSKSYSKQSAFHGSRRQIRGQVIRLLTERDYASTELIAELGDERATSVIQDLITEGLIEQHGEVMSILAAG